MKAVTNSGMTVLKSNSCLFISDWVVAVVFVDDILFWSKEEAYINELRSKLHEQGLLLKQENDSAGFWGC